MWVMICWGCFCIVEVVFVVGVGDEPPFGCIWDSDAMGFVDDGKADGGLDMWEAALPKV